MSATPTLNLSNQQVAIVTRRGQPTTVTITATANDGTPFDLEPADVTAQVTTDKGGAVVEFTPAADGNVLTLTITAAALESAIGPIARDSGEFKGRWFVNVQHPELGDEPVPWVDGSFTVLAHGSRTAATSNAIDVTVGASVSVQLAAPGPRGPRVDPASEAEAIAGTDDTKAMTPATTSRKLPWPDVREWGVTGFGVVDDSAALQAALDELGVVHLRSDGVYRLEASLLRTASTSIFGHGATIVQAFDGPVLAVDAAWGTPMSVSSIAETTHQFPGSSVAIPAVAVDIGAAHTFELGDTIKLLSDDNPIGGTTGDPSTRTGQMMVIGDIAGTVLYCAGFLRDPMTTGLRVVHVPDVDVELHDVRIQADELTRTAALIELAGVRPTLRNVQLRDVPAVGVDLIGCHDIDINGLDMARGRNSDGSTYRSYGIRALACEGGTITGVRGRQLRHAFTTVSVNNLAGTTQVKHVGRTAGLVVSGEAIDCYGAPWDTHEMSYGTTFVGCVTRHTRSGFGASNSVGMQLRGRHDSAIGCVVDGVELGYRVSNDRTGNATHITFTGCKALNVAQGLRVDDNVGGEAIVTWDGGQIVARLNGVRSDAAKLTTVRGADIVLVGAAESAFFATEASPLRVVGGSVDATAATASPKFASATLGSRIEVDGPRLRGTFAELVDSTRPGKLVARNLDTTEATITSAGGNRHTPVLGDLGLDWSASGPYPAELEAPATLDVTVWDTFARADGEPGTADSGGTWTQRSAGLAIKGGALAQTASSGSSLFTTPHTTANGAVEAAVTCYGAGAFAGVVVRYVDLNNHLYVELTATELRLRRRLAGSFSTLAAVPVARVSAERYRIVVDLADASIVGRLIDTGGRRIASVAHTLTDGDETTFGAATEVGVRAAFTAASTVVFHAFVARA